MSKPHLENVYTLKHDDEVSSYQKTALTSIN